MDDAEEIIKTKKNKFEKWLKMVFVRGSDKRKYSELIHDLSIQYMIENNQYLKTSRKEVDAKRKVKFKSENKNKKSNTQKQNKMEVVSKINQIKRVLHKHINMKK